METEYIEAETEPGLSGMDLVKHFNSELNSMCETKPPVSKAKMISVTKSAMKAHRMYKHVVHCVEKFIQKCRAEYKVPGLYVMDSIVRQSKHQFPNEKEVFAPRFAKNIQTTFNNLLKCREVEIPKLVRVLNLWQKNGIYSPSVIQPLLAMVAPRPGSQSSLVRAETKPDQSLNAAEVVAANAVAIIQQQQTHIQALLQQQAQQQLANLSPNLLQNIQSLQSLLSNANIVTPVAATPAITASTAISIPLSSTLEKLKEAASSVLGLTGSTASGTAHSSSMAELEPAQEFKPKLKPHQLQHINQFLEQQETAQNHEYINEVNQPTVVTPPPPPPPQESDSEQQRMERNLREFEREHKISHRKSSHESSLERRSRHFESRVQQLGRHVQISDDEGGVDMEVGTPSPPMFEDTTRSFLDDFDYGDDQGEDERIEEQKRRVSQERNRIAKQSEHSMIRFPLPHPPISTSTPLQIKGSLPQELAQPKLHIPHQNTDKIGDSIPTISRIQLGSSRVSPEKTKPPFLPNVISNPASRQPPPPLALPWGDPSLRQAGLHLPPTLSLPPFARPMLPSLPPGIPSQHLFPPPFIPPQQHGPPFSIAPPRPPFHQHADMVPPIIGPPPQRPLNPQDSFPHPPFPRAEFSPKEPFYPRERDGYPPGPPLSSPLRETSNSPRGAFSRWRLSPSPPPDVREREKKRQRIRKDSKEASYEHEERRRYRSRSRSPERDRNRDRDRRARKHQKSHSPIERKERNKRREKSRSPRDKRKRRDSEIKEKERIRATKESEREFGHASNHSPPSQERLPPLKWKALESVDSNLRVKEFEAEKVSEFAKFAPKKDREREKKKHTFSLAKVNCVSVLSTTIWVQIRKITPNIERIIREKCEEFGPVVSFDLIPSRGCAFVGMETRDSAEKLVNEEREVKLGGVSSKFVYAPGMGVKDDSFKPHWDSIHGITYVPWSVMSDPDFDLNELQEGGVLDPDSLPPGVNMPDKKAVSAEINIPTATIFMPLPPLLPPFPTNIPPSSENLNSTSNPSFPTIPPVRMLALPPPDAQPPISTSIPPVAFTQPIEPQENWVLANESEFNQHPKQFDQPPFAAPFPMTSVPNEALSPNSKKEAALMVPYDLIHKSDSAEIRASQGRAVPALLPFPPSAISLIHAPYPRSEQDSGVGQFLRQIPDFRPTLRQAHPPPFRPRPEFRIPGPDPRDLEFSHPPFPNVRPHSLPHPRPHPEPRFRIPPPPPMRGIPNRPNEFRFPPPRGHRPPLMRHEFRVPAPPSEMKNHQSFDSINEDKKTSPSLLRPSTPPGYKESPPRLAQNVPSLSPSDPDVSSLSPPCDTTSPFTSLVLQGAETSAEEPGDPLFGRPGKPLVAEYSDVYSPHSEDGSGELSGLQANPSYPPSF